VVIFKEKIFFDPFLGWLTYLGISSLGLAVLVGAAPAPLRLRRDAVRTWWAGYSCLLTCIKNTGNALVAGPRHAVCVAAYEILQLCAYVLLT
jgi:hypothetical protein